MDKQNTNHTTVLKKKTIKSNHTICSCPVQTISTVLSKETENLCIDCDIPGLPYVSQPKYTWSASKLRPLHPALNLPSIREKKKSKYKPNG